MNTSAMLRPALIAGLVFGSVGIATAGPVTATRLDGDPTTPNTIDPIVDRSTFEAVSARGGGNINGPSVIRVPDWIPPAERTHPDANYYMYFANHRGDDIRLAWADAPTGPWRLFNTGTAPGRAWGDGDYTGTPTPGNGVLDLHLDDYLGTDADAPDAEQINIDGPGVNTYSLFDEVASPDVFVDDVNQRIVMYFHSRSQGANKDGTQDHTGRTLTNQHTFVTTSKYGLNFNHADQADPADPEGSGIRETLLGQFYFRVFEVRGEIAGRPATRSFAFANRGFLYKAPLLTEAGENATMANADEPGSLWHPTHHDRAWWQLVPQHENPLHGIRISPDLKARTRNKQRQDAVRNVGEFTNAETPRHFAIYHDPDRDADTIYVFYTSRGDMPESIVLGRFTLAGLDGEQRLEPANWSLADDTEQLILSPELDWEGANHPLAYSANGAQTGVRQLRDPCILVDNDGSIYLFYTGAGEEAIGIAELTFASTP